MLVPVWSSTCVYTCVPVCTCLYMCVRECRFFLVLAQLFLLQEIHLAPLYRVLCSLISESHLQKFKWHCFFFFWYEPILIGDWGSVILPHLPYSGVAMLSCETILWPWLIMALCMATFPVEMAQGWTDQCPVTVWVSWPGRLQSQWSPFMVDFTGCEITSDRALGYVCCSVKVPCRNSFPEHFSDHLSNQKSGCRLTGPFSRQARFSQQLFPFYTQKGFL